MEILLTLSAMVTVLEAAQKEVGGRYRAAVYLEDEGKLRMAYSSPGYSVEEIDLRWGLRQGAVGMCWATNRSQDAPTPYRPDVLHDWEVPESALDAVKHVRMVVARPIHMRATPAICSAVFVIDDTLPPGRAAATLKKVADQFVPEIRDTLERTGLEFP